MEINRNLFKQAMKDRKLQIGLWSSMCSNLSAEIVAHSGFDWILLDTEHSPNELPGLMSQLQALRGGTAMPVVRAAWNDTVLIKRILDIGAQSILLPYVQNAEEAKRAVQAVRYPPNGVRGVAAGSRASNFGRINGYLTKADAEICLLVQVETRSALDQIEAIAGVEGVDGVFIGPADLSASLGHLGNAHIPRRRPPFRMQPSVSPRSARRPAFSPASRRKRGAISSGAITSSRSVPTRRCCAWPPTISRSRSKADLPQSMPAVVTASHATGERLAARGA